MVIEVVNGSHRLESAVQTINVLSGATSNNPMVVTTKSTVPQPPLQPITTIPATAIPTTQPPQQTTTAIPEIADIFTLH